MPTAHMLRRRADLFARPADEGNHAPPFQLSEGAFGGMALGGGGGGGGCISIAR
ncbi:MAG: hypothetical protein M3019_05405 [Candidatus Dormibacteraeota bacterium]|nr:hypothetical protein [Candidatus Dormibacteraeota bacterium]